MRILLTIPTNQSDRLKELVSSGNFLTQQEVIRFAITKYLSEKADANATN